MPTLQALAAIAVNLIAVACFAIVLVRSRVVSIAQNVASVATSGVSAMLDPSLDDMSKERAVQRAGLQLLKHSWQMAWRIFAALAAVAAPLVLADMLGLVSLEASSALLMRVDFLIAVSVGAVAIAWITARRATRAVPSAAPATPVESAGTAAYGTTDRLLHALAFAGPGTQRALSRLDTRLCSGQIVDGPTAPPVFITSLARGGTTALLNALHDLPTFATQRYCDMPFLTAPMLWSKLSGRRNDAVERQRAHGDGLTIGLQSPEAFDEVFWMMGWPEKYEDARIALWNGSDAKPDARAFMELQFRKTMSLRRGVGQQSLKSVRYLSKNNANIARLNLLPKMFPGCQIVVPLREPSAHAASLHRQHMNFTKLHAEDPFVRRYMRDIGHFEFGALHRPIAFDIDALAGSDPTSPEYWLRYWITCFEHITAHRDAVILVAQDDLRSAPDRTMSALVERLNVNVPQAIPWRGHFHSKGDAPQDGLFSEATLHRAREIYRTLLEEAVGREPDVDLTHA